MSIIIFAASILESIDGLMEISILFPYLFLFVVAGIFFQSSLSKNKSAYLFNLPVTTGEKLCSAMVALMTVGVIFHILMVVGTYTGYYFVRPIFHDRTNIFVTNVWSILKMSFGALDYYLLFAAVGSTFLFGSIYFKKLALLKTFSLGIGCLLIIQLYNSLLLFITFGISTPNTTRLSMLNVAFYGEYSNAVFAIITLFFLSLTYLRLKETEV